MSDWKLIALDIDGTTIVRGAELSDENWKWIIEAKREGVPVTFATGRHRSNRVLDYVDKLGIEVPFVTLNGGEVWTADGQLLTRKALDESCIPFLYDIAMRYNVHFWGATAEQSMNRSNFPSTLEGHTWIKFGYSTDDTSVLARIWAALEEHGDFSLSNSDPYNVEVNAPGATKASGLQVVVNHLGISPENVVVMGDSLNDISMFQWAGLAVAMGNAQESVKHAAHQVTSRCEEDGVATIIKQVLTSNGSESTCKPRR